MKALSIFKCYLLIMILSGNSFLFLISINKLPISPLDTIALTNSSYISSFDFDSSPYNELYLVFNERQMDNSKLFFIAADSDYQWNFTTETILEENATLKLNNNPSIITSLEKIWIANSYTYGYDNGILLLSKNYLDKIWQKTIPYQMFNKSVFEPNLKLDESNQSIWLSWKDNHENTLNYYYMIYNITSGIWSNQFSLNIVNEYNCSTSDFIIDESGNAHFVWSQGGDFFKQIFYRYVMSNGTQGSVETITDGTTNCINPAIVFDSYNYLNVFWENQTIPFPQAYGTISIETSRKIIEGSWSQSFEVAPFIPVERPPSGESDAYQPAVTVDKSNNLWLAYKINEDYAYRQGIDIRNRQGLTWEPSSQLSLINALAISPNIKCDNAGNLHCLWMDIRRGYYQIYYRVKFTNNFWSDEILLTRISNTTGSIWKIILIVLVSVIVFSIPVYFLNRYLRIKAEKQLKKKLDLLD